MARIANRRQHSDPRPSHATVTAGDDAHAVHEAASRAHEDAQWAASVLGCCRAVCADRQKLYPPGKIMWKLPAHEDADAGARWMTADPSEFDHLLLCGSQMFTAHLPSAYAHVLLGELPIASNTLG